MFELDTEELEIWRTQIASSKSDRMGLRHPPFCFAEQGITMLSCVLNSERAIAVNIQVIRIFSKMKEALLSHKDILLQLEKIERKLVHHDENIAVIFGYLKKLLNPAPTPRRRIGFRRSNELTEE